MFVDYYVILKQEKGVFAMSHFQKWKINNHNKWKKLSERNQRKTHLYGKEILSSPKFKKSKDFIQHGNISVRKHSINVALTALKISKSLPIKTNEKDIVRGALLHDYFLYDWHKKKVTPKHILKFYKMHGFTHPTTALNNASKDFKLNKREKDIIKKHMWPLTIVPPMCREAWIVTMADKYCSLLETLHIHKK